MILTKNCFEIVKTKLSEEIKDAEIKDTEKDIFEVKTKKNSYQIRLDRSKNVIFLEGNSEKVLSSWLFDEENISNKDLKLIVSDFISIISSKPKNNPKQAKKKNSKDESNVTGLFFANRMVGIFPDIKSLIQEEKESFSEFRAAYFTKNIILPRINELLNSSKSGNAQVKKLGKLLSDLYENAGIDVRSIITMCILNNVENKECLKNNLSEKLQKAWNHSMKYKGKKVKPEKVKKKSWLSKAYEYQREMENNK